MSQITLLPEPPRGFESTARYAIRPREKRAFHSILEAKHVVDTDPARGSVVELTQDADGVLFVANQPILRGQIEERIMFSRGSGGLLTKSMSRRMLDKEGRCLREEGVAEFHHPAMPLPEAAYPEVALPFCLGWLPLDGKRRSVYAWINDRFVAKVYVESAGRSRLTLPIGARDAVEVIFYPDLNDWIALGSVLTRLAKPFIPKYYMWVEPEAPYRLLRFEGPYGPPGAPEITLELASVTAK